MAVLVEANSVIIRVEALIARFAGGWEAFKARVPNQTLCTDSEIVRVGFVLPEDVESFIGMLERNGLTYLRDGEAVDIAIAVQLHGLDWRCSWLELGYVDLGNDPRRRIAACRLPGSACKQIVTPPGWEFEGSVSEIYGFARAEHRPSKQGGRVSWRRGLRRPHERSCSLAIVKVIKGFSRVVVSAPSRPTSRKPLRNRATTGKPVVSDR